MEKEYSSSTGEDRKKRRFSAVAKDKKRKKEWSSETSDDRKTKIILCSLSTAKSTIGAIVEL